MDDNKTKVSYLTVDEVIDVNGNYSIRYLRSALDSFIRDWIYGTPSVFKSNLTFDSASDSPVCIDILHCDEDSNGGLLRSNDVAGLSEGGRK